MRDDTGRLGFVVQPSTAMPGHLEVTLSAALTETTPDLLQGCPLPLLQSGRQVVVDVSKIRVVDDAAISVLGNLQHTAHRAGTCVHLVATADSQLGWDLARASDPGSRHSDGLNGVTPRNGGETVSQAKASYGIRASIH